MKINRQRAYILLAFAFIFVLTCFLQSQEKVHPCSLDNRRCY